MLLMKVLGRRLCFKTIKFYSISAWRHGFRGLEQVRGVCLFEKQISRVKINQFSFFQSLIGVKLLLVSEY